MTCVIDDIECPDYEAQSGQYVNGCGRDCFGTGRQGAPEWPVNELFPGC